VGVRVSLGALVLRARRSSWRADWLCQQWEAESGELALAMASELPPALVTSTAGTSPTAGTEACARACAAFTARAADRLLTQREMAGTALVLCPA
jgi:hypothetical protein